MDPLKEAFQKIKKDILSLKNDLSSLKSEVSEVKTLINTIKENKDNINLQIPQQRIQTQPTFQPRIGHTSALQHNVSPDMQDYREIPYNDGNNIQTDSHSDINNHILPPNMGYPMEFPVNQTDQRVSTSDMGVQTGIQTDNMLNNGQNIPLQPLYPQKTHFSIGNEGVQTDKPTNQLTNTQIEYQEEHRKINEQEHAHLVNLNDTLSKFEKVNEILASLDDVKREIRQQFKGLTPQEMLVFSTLYTLEDQRIEEIGYFLLAKSINLTESSIRDYVNKLIKKGIPIDKTRLNNKKIILKISPNLKKIATLSTIMKLRDL